MNPEQLSEQARRAMVEGQVRPNKVTDRRIIEAMETIDRALFAREEQAGYVYVDEDLPLGDDHYLIEPVVMARLIQAADIQENDMVLEIGASSGYGTALISSLANTVVSVDQSEAYVEWASKNLTDVGADNAVVLHAELENGAADQGPYDVIVVSGAVEDIPASLTDQLADGGRLITVVRGDGDAFGEARLIRKQGGELSSTGLFDAGTPLIMKSTKNKGFVF
jgi:protein-L-isoaspartate(D-aspartate) O-methyltransferase